MKAGKLIKRLAILSVAGAGVFYGATVVYPSLASRYKKPAVEGELSKDELQRINCPLPTREDLIKGIKCQEMDVLVIGGGATGLGVALDATTRGLKTGLVEKFDFSSGTSSRSTKLIHGGVRYLQKAVFNLDYEQYKMVKEALAERANLIEIAPHLAYPLPIMLPVYKWWQVPYYWAGVKAYDFVAGSELLKPSYLLSKRRALEEFPMLKKDKLKAALVYYDGQHDDARMAVSLAITAVRHGAYCLNYTKCEKLLTTCVDGKEKVCGALVRNTLTGEEYEIKAKCVINATGPYTDSIRQMANKQVQKICQPSAGVHIVLPDYYSPTSMGLLDPSTSDGRVIFFLPWQNVTLAGTTDDPCCVTDNPMPTEKDIQFILNEIRNYLSPDVEVRRGDVLSAWSGIRPLVSDPNKNDTQSIARNHIIEVSKNKLITIAGGKWTTYRSMAEETVDRAVQECCLQPTGECATKGLLLEGAHGWSPTLFIRLVQDYGLENAVAQHLAQTYGDKAFKVASLSKMTGKRWPIIGKRLHEEYPYIEAEVKYAIREYACRAIDIVARRTRLSFINVHAAQEALPRIVDIMAEELKWDEKTKKRELEEAECYLCNDMARTIINCYRCPTCPGLPCDFEGPDPCPCKTCPNPCGTCKTCGDGSSQRFDPCSRRAQEKPCKPPFLKQ
ncbi:glycerol-3-phosphate dehydrogenase, mitochondrial-like isoform X2 [Physella acuta]|uniref:glycerol-3-phosphate dehydrogenase, mitochondrial-like isoform X2 n=1 Tax=Physella acuta TaxID=109671 RepID=UPI0027DCB076|nr:glycerol-3-phosphate dehydrogenase, mitochondrial-like isoform X2 [Physella acuta]